MWFLPSVAMKGKVRGLDEGLGGRAIWREDATEMTVKARRAARGWGNNPNKSDHNSD